MNNPIKPPKEFLQEAGVDESFLYKMMFGRDARPRTIKTTNTLPPAKKQEKKKTPAKKQLYTPPKPFQMPAPPLVQFAAFKGFYQELISQEKKKRQVFMFNLDVLYSIYKQSNIQGGLLYVSSIGNFPSIVKKVLQNIPLEQIKLELTPQLIQRVRQFLYSIQFINANPNEKKKIYQLRLVNFVGKIELKEHTRDITKGLTYFNYDLTLFQEGAEALGIDKRIFNPEYMCEHYKKEIIDIRIQNPMDYGFQISRLKNKKYEMTLGEYRYYQLNCQNPQKMKTFKHLDQLGKGQIFFGVNFEPSDQMLNIQIKKNVENTFLDFHGDFDLLSFLDRDVPGCSLPQMYFKTSGCWTGGHQENINMSALNINHGPDASEWYTLDLVYVQKLRQQLKQIYNLDLYLSQGLWYEKIDWFLSHGYPVKRFLQRKDDIVVTGPGTLHWVRSFGTAIQTSWNIMPKNYQQIYAAFQRHRVNKRIKFHKSDTIPLKSIILKYLNHERTVMSEKIRILCANQLEQWYNNQMDIVDELEDRVKHKSYYYLKDLESFCCLCKQEVLVYFLAAPEEYQKGISCLECFKKQSKKNFNIQELYYKQQCFWVKQLIDICKNGNKNLAQPDEIQQLCRGFHVGKIQKECKVSKREKLPILVDINDQEKKNCLQQFYNENKELLQLHNYLDQSFKNNSMISTQTIEISIPEISSIPETKYKERLIPVCATSGKMMIINEMIEERKQSEAPQPIKPESEPTPPPVVAKELLDKQVQTYIETEDKQISVNIEMSRNRSRSRSKSREQKKPKQKCESNTKKWPTFLSDEEQNKKQLNSSVGPEKKDDNKSDRRIYYNDRQSSNQNYMEGIQGSKNYGYHNNQTKDWEFRDRNPENSKQEVQKSNNEEKSRGFFQKSNQFHKKDKKLQSGFRNNKGVNGHNKCNYRENNGPHTKISSSKLDNGPLQY